MVRETVTWRYLPHWYMPGAAFFVTYRVANSLPQVALERLKAKRELLIQSRPADGVSPGEHRLRAHKLWFAEYDALLDQQPADIDLSERSLAALLRENLYRHHGTKYYLLAYCIMPNHVHVVLQPIEDKREEETRGPRVQRGEEVVGECEDERSPLAKIMHSLKSYTAHAANQLLDRTGGFWQRESYDH